MQREQIGITAADGASSKITVFAADPALDAPVLVCIPAMGTAARYYEPLAGPIVREGWRFVTADLRGIGSSSVRVKRGVDFGYREMVELDWPAVVQKARERFSGSAVYLLGHSLGGQLSCLYLAANPSAVAGLVLAAAPSVYWRGWDIALNAGVTAGTQAACAVARVLGYFPGRRLGFGGSEARRVMRDWARQARTGRYEPRGAAIDCERLLSELDAPVLAFSFEGDFLSPPRAVGNLLAKMRRARVTHVTLADDALDHFRWVRNPDVLVGKIREWMPSDNV